jgi:hypothetical protein
MFPNATSTSHDTTIPGPPFIMYQPRPGEQESEVNPGRQVVVVVNEGEGLIDIHDTLSESAGCGLINGEPAA